MKQIPVSAKLSSLAESLTVAVDVKIQERVALGEDIVNFGVGQPDFPTPEFIREAARQAVEDGATRYTPPGGTPELRKAAADYLRETGVPAEAAETVVSCGAKHSLFNAMTATLEPGDEVLLPVPYWVTYPEQAKMADAVPVPVVPAQGLRVTPQDLERHRTERTRMMVLNSPNNPSGTVYPRPEVEALAEWCVKHNILIVSDEIYDRLVYDNMPATSVAALGPEVAAQTITINGVSKSFAMTGWRIGFMHAPRPVTDAILKFQGQTTGNPAAVSQAAALAAVRGPREIVETMRAAYERRRDLVIEGLTGMEGVELEIPHGAFYAFPRVAGAVKNLGGSVPLAAKLVEAGVGVVPGVGFGADDHVRISFAVSEERLTAGVERLCAGLKPLL